MFLTRVSPVQPLADRPKSKRAGIMRGALVTFALLGALLGSMTTEAQARIFVGVGVGVPLFYPPFVPPPPVYYPPYYGPPVVYAPPGNTFSYTPPGQYAPPGYAPPGPQSLAPPSGYGPSNSYAQACQAGAYVCPLVQDTPPGGRCSCPGNDGRRIRGQAN
jgi:hypothetical protein